MPTRLTSLNIWLSNIRPLHIFFYLDYRHQTVLCSLCTWINGTTFCILISIFLYLYRLLVFLDSFNLILSFLFQIWRLVLIVLFSNVQTVKLWLLIFFFLLVVFILVVVVIVKWLLLLVVFASQTRLRCHYWRAIRCFFCVPWSLEFIRALILSWRSRIRKLSLSWAILVLYLRIPGPSRFHLFDLLSLVIWVPILFLMLIKLVLNIIRLLLAMILIVPMHKLLCC